jgi:hypothetical protein
MLQPVSPTTMLSTNGMDIIMTTELSTSDFQQNQEQLLTVTKTIDSETSNTDQGHQFQQLGMAIPSLCCKVCSCDACDLRFTNCGCLIHAVRYMKHNFDISIESQMTKLLRFLQNQE